MSAIAASLCACNTPGVTVYGDPVTGYTSKGRSVSYTPKLVGINADIIGDIEVPGRLKITTAKDGNGNFAMTQIPITLKDGTTVITSQPMVAQIKTASVWDAFFSGLKGVVGEVGGWATGATAVGAVGPALGTAAGAIPKP